MDHIRTISVERPLGACQDYEVSLDLPDFERRDLVRVELCITAEVLPPSSTYVALAYRPVVRILVGRKDVTTKYFGAIYRSIDSDPKLRTQFNSAAERRITQLERTGYYWGQGASMQTQLARLSSISTKKIESIFNGCDLGESPDSFGIIHPCHYIFGSVHVPPVSIGDLGLNLSDLASSPDVTVEMSATAYRMNARIQAFMHFVDPTLEAINQRLVNLEGEVTSLGDALNAIDQRITEVSTDIGTTNSAIVGVEASARAISEAVKDYLNSKNP